MALKAWGVGRKVLYIRTAYEGDMTGTQVLDYLDIESVSFTDDGRGCGGVALKVRGRKEVLTLESLDSDGEIAVRRMLRRAPGTYPSVRLDRIVTQG